MARQHPASRMANPSGGPSADITQLLHAWHTGDRAALDRLITLVYDELHAIAAKHMAREWRHRSVETTGLVNEAYVRLVDQRNVNWQNRAHFFAIAAQVMRRILVDRARRHLADKRAGEIVEVDATTIAAPQATLDRIDILTLDRALEQLDELDPDQARIVELRFFGGLTVEETATVMRSSPATVKREWAVAKAWLYRALTAKASPV